jgi:hypothetical protein
MKIKILLAGLLGVISVTAFAQKAELKNAQDAYDKYEGFRSANAGGLANSSIKAAKAAIDKAAANDKTATLPQTYALKAAVYSSLSSQDTVAATSLPLYTVAEEAVTKAKALDTKGEFKPLIDNTIMNLAQYKLNQGVVEYRDKKYDLAYASFDTFRKYLPEDTNAIYYTGLAAANTNNYDVALTHFNKLLTTKYSKNDIIYNEISNINLVKKDTTAALKAIAEGMVKYPASGDLRKRQIEIYLQSGKQQEVVGQIQTAIAADPKNKTLYYYAGITYSQLGEALTKEIAKTKDAAAKAKVQASKADFYTKSADMYKKALEIDPSYFDAILNIGYVLISPAIETFNAANQLPDSRIKEYDAAIAKSGVLFDVAKPYLLKAVELNPKSTDALENLKTYYLGKKDATNAAATDAKLKALK